MITTLPVIVEALLGQGEALDCYNQKLQESATLNAELLNEKLVKENEELQQKIDAINNIADPIQKAENYKKIFGDCCEVPQVGYSCPPVAP